MEITVEQLMKINLVTETYKDDENKMTAELLRIIHGSLDIEKSEADKSLLELMKVIKNDHDLVQKFVYNGTEYGFIPNLSKISAGEFIDLDNYLSAEDKQFHKIMAVLYRPVKSSAGKFYEIEKYEGTEKYSNEMLGVDCRIALGAMVFFYNLSKSLLNHTNIYIQKEMKKMTNK